MAAKKTTVKIKGGAALAAALKSIEAKLATGKLVKVGFLGSQNYPPVRNRGTTPHRKAVPVPIVGVAQVAFWNEYGTKFAPPRPFFRTMIADKAPGWGDSMGKILKATGYNADVTLGHMGQLLQGQLVQSIKDTNAPANAARTVWLKNGASKPLVDTGLMMGSANYEVET